jgi:hypothetical protein
MTRKLIDDDPAHYLRRLIPGRARRGVHGAGFRRKSPPP